MNTHRLELFWTKEQILAECQAEIKKHEFQADYDRRSVRKLSEIIQSQQEELHCGQAEELERRDQQLLHVQLLQQNSELREAHNESFNEMEELKKFQSSNFDTIPRRRLVEDQDTILELTGKIQELQNENNCMNDSRDFQDAESVRSGNSHVTSRPVSFPPRPIPEGMLSRSTGMPSRREGPPSIWDTHGISGNVFANPDASSSPPYPQELNPWSSRTEEPIHSSTVEKSERQTQDKDQRCQSGLSAKNSVIFSGGDCRFQINSVYKEFLEIVGNGSPTGNVPEETIAVSVTISITCENVTPSNPSPNSFMWQNERKPSRTRSPRVKSPSGRMSRWPCKDYLKGTCTNSFCEKWHPPECLFYKTKGGC